MATEDPKELLKDETQKAVADDSKADEEKKEDNNVKKVVHSKQTILVDKETKAKQLKESENFLSFMLDGKLDLISTIDQKDIFLQCLGNYKNPPYVYLNGLTASFSVGLSAAYDYANYSGAQWKVLFDSTTQAHCLECLGKDVPQGEIYYLNHNNAAKSVTLLSQNVSVNSIKWIITQNGSANDYCVSPQDDTAEYVNGITAKGTVNLSPSNSVADYSGAHWKIGVIGVTNSDIQAIIKRSMDSVFGQGVFGSVNFKYYPADASYETFADDVITQQWNSSGLKNYQWKQEKFDCDDFAIVMKGAVSKYMYNIGQSSPRGSAFGIMWGTMNGGAHAYNFYITPWLELKLFEPQNGQTITQDTAHWYKPYFVLL